MVRKKWWGYIKAIIRAYPKYVTPEEKKAVDIAIEQVKLLSDGDDRLRFLDMVFWKKNTIAGAAMKIPCSERTAQRWHADFIYRVAKNYSCKGGLR